MPKQTLPIIAVIPAHNAEKTLSSLINELIAQKYDEIVVLDDASTDATAKVARSYKAKVRLIGGEKQVGSGANRNRIIGQTGPALLHFIDADMKLLSNNTPELIQGLDWPKSTAYICGMVRNPDDLQNPYNFGPRPSLLRSLEAVLQYLIWRLGLKAKFLAVFARFLCEPLLHSWPNIYKPAKRRQAFWAAESNMVIDSQIFAETGGYDPDFKYSEVSDYSLRLYRQGLKVYFDPTIDVLHPTWDNILSRKRERLAARRLFIKKHGRLNAYFPKLADFIYSRE